MDGEDVSSGAKKRSKLVETDDNELIGSMFKARKPRDVKKKVSLATEGTGGGEGENAGSRGGLREGLGGLDDTLANFRKRLKGPKKEQGSGAARGKKAFALNEGLDEKSSLNEDNVCVGLAVGDGGSDLAMDMKIMGSCEVKLEGPNMDLTLKGTEGHALSVGDLVAKGSRSTAEDEKGVGVIQKSESQNVNDGLSMCCKSSPEIAKGVCHPTIPDEPLVDPRFSTNACYGGSQQLSCVQPEDICSPSDQKVALQEGSFNDGLKKCSAMLHDVEGKIDTVSLTEVGEGVCRFSEGELKDTLPDEQAQVCNSTPKHGDFTYMDKAKLFSCDSELLTKSSENLLNENNHMVSGKNFLGSSRNGTLKLSGCRTEVDEDVNSETKFVCWRNCCDRNNLDTKAETHGFVVGFFPEINSVNYGGSLDPVVSNEANESELAIKSNHPEKPLETSNIPKDSNSSIPKCTSVLDPTQPCNNTFEEGSLPNDDCFYTKKDTDGASSQGAIPEENENCEEYAVSGSEVANKDNKASASTRRKAKKRRHGDMAYEGDGDWEVLINDQAFLESQGGLDGEHIHRPRVKFDSSLNDAVEESDSVAVAVSAGLKAHAAGPVEKIRFKEILKRKGGLQEYLNCRSVYNFQTGLCICLQLVFPCIKKGFSIFSATLRLLSSVLVFIVLCF